MTSAGQSGDAGGDTASAELSVQPGQVVVHLLSGKILFPSSGSTVWFLLALHRSPLSRASSRKGVGESALAAGEGRSTSAQAAAVTEVLLLFQHPW